MSKESDLARLLECGIVAVVRSPKAEAVGDIADALLAGGVEAIEVTFTVPKAHRVLEQVVDRLGDRVLIGAGTVLDPETARTALLAGARYIVSPTLNLDVIRMCQRYSRLAMPGAFTPTEILTAWETGADIVKVFPSDVTGPAYLKAILGPLPHVRLMPTGGLSLSTAADFLRAGACALGVGSSLVDPQAIATGDMKTIEDLARQFVDVVRQTRRTAS